MKIYNRRKVGGDYFRLYRDNKNGFTLEYWLDKFDFDNYYVFKATGHQKEVSYNEFLDFEFSGYVFFRKDLYKKQGIENWINYMVSFGGIQYLVKPLPPFNPDKIIIRK
jgi:hypothetical protein